MPGECAGRNCVKYYYTAREAQQQLGINVGAFYYLVDTGKLKKLTPPGKKQGFYSKHQIERLVKEEPHAQAGEKAAGVAFMQATLDDIPEEYELAVLMLNGSTGYGVPAYETWLRKNDATNFLVRDHGRLVAFMHVLPVAPESIKRWLKGEIREWEISAEDVQSYTSQGPLECIILCMVTTADVDERTRRLYGMRLLRGYLQFVHDLAGLGITITRYYAACSSPEVMDMLRRANFTERGALGKRVAFELNPLTAGMHMAKQYRAVLKRNKHLLARRIEN
jgi:hypothetical protein